MPGEEHPSPSALERFLRGELPRDEARAVVRHLLRGCPVCGAVTGRLWALGEEPLRPIREEEERWDLEEIVMTDIESAQSQLRDIVRDLEEIKLRLQGVRESLPPAVAESFRLLEMEQEPADPRTEIRTVIECVLNDSLEPAIQDLRGASGLSTNP